jgi:hypothetical protein
LAGTNRRPRHWPPFLQSRPDVWGLDQVAQRYHQRPSDLIELVEAGYSSVTRYAFDRAVCTLAQRIAAQMKDTVEELVPAESTPPKGMVRARRPAWTLAQLLYDHPDDELERDDADVAVPDALGALPTAGL